MHLNGDTFFLHRRCVDCPAQAPTCNCGIGQQCIITSRVCDACPSASCVDPAVAATTSKSGSVSGGAIAGAVIGVLILLGATVGLLFWYRRRQRAENANPQGAMVEPKPDVPARAEAVLSRPDPVEKPSSPSPSPHEHTPESVRMYSVMSNSTINLDPHKSHRGSVQSNPFTDTHSIQTTSASTQSTNVIPIALVPHGSVSSPPHSPGGAASDNRSGISNSSSSAPPRPAHSPELGLRFDPLSSSLNLEHVNVSKESFQPRPPNARYAQSQVSGVSGFSSRDSVMTSGSFASDVLYEAPQIVTNAGRVNVLKAEVVSVQGTHTAPGTPMSTNQSLKPTSASRVSKAPARSPLAQSSFGPADTLSVSESDEGQEVVYHPQRNNHNPFGDEHSPRLQTGNTTSTFGGSTPVPIPSTASPGDQYQANHRASQEIENDIDSPANGRPLSTLTQATSIIGAEIGGATVVRLNSTSSANNRLTSARLVTPTSGPLRSADDRVLQQQQAQALAAARARAAASGLPMPGMPSYHHSGSSGTSIGGSSVGNSSPLHSRRVSEASVMSAGADSLLESFTFVPPSPISSRPPRSPSSPLAQQAGVGAVPPVPPLPREVQEKTQTKREVAGLSTLSSTSTGIEGYDFRIDDGQGQGEQTRASVASTFGPGTGVYTGKGPSSPLSREVNANVSPNKSGSKNANGSKPPPSAANNKKNGVNANGDGTTTIGGLKGRQRASLDTLALTADLSAFPLSFDEGRGFGAGAK